MRSLFFKILITIFILNINLTYAQGIPITGSGVDMLVSTENPNPGQTITITARSYSIDINSSELTWIVDDKIIQKGTGLTKLEIIAPPLGKKKNINLSVISQSGVKLTNSITINSSSVDMIIEHDGYTPASFKGKIPVSYQNNIKIIAIPHLANQNGSEYDPKNLVYQWKKNSRVLEDSSGYGKQTLNLPGDIVPRPVSIEVIISTIDNTQKTIGYASISFASPSIYFYIDSPLYGPLLNSTIKDAVYIGKEKETSIISIPFGFNRPINSLGDLVLTWMINGYERTELEKNETITLRSPENSSGSSNIELTIKNNKQILQGSSASFSAKFSSN